MAIPELKDFLPQPYASGSHFASSTCRTGVVSESAESRAAPPGAAAAKPEDSDFGKLSRLTVLLLSSLSPYRSRGARSTFRHKPPQCLFTAEP